MFDPACSSPERRAEGARKRAAGRGRRGTSLLGPEQHGEDGLEDSLLTPVRALHAPNGPRARGVPRRADLHEGTACAALSAGAIVHVLRQLPARAA